MFNYVKYCLLITGGMFIACSPKSLGNTEITEAEVRSFVDHYDESWNAKDSVAVKSYLSDDYRYFTSTGSFSTRNESLAFLSDTAYVIHKASRTELEILIQGNIATVNSHWVGDLTWKGEAIHDNQRCGLTIAKIGGKLKLISEHCVAIQSQ